MIWYCEKCRKHHSDDEMCPQIQSQLASHPEWLSEAANFTTIAGEYALITSNTLNNVSNGVNKLLNTNFSYEGTHQFARDIQVFKRLSEEPFKNAGTFLTPDNAKAYLEGVKNAANVNPRVMTSFEAKLTGYAQEVDWLRFKQSQLSSVFQKSSLLSNNAAGIDGTTVSRFTGNTISNTTIKASKNAVTQNSTMINDVKEAIAKGTASEKDIIFSTKGTKLAAQKAGLKNPVIEKNSIEQVNASNARLEEKIMSGKAVTSVTGKQVLNKAMQGAVIGAAVGLTVSGITNYIRYKNGESSLEDVFADVSKDTLKSTVTGAGMGAITIFLPSGAIGLIAGMVIGVYINTVCTNVLDEIYGKGAYGAILNASGYIYGMTYNLAEYLQKIEANYKKTQGHIKSAMKIQKQIEDNFELFEQMKGE